MTTGPCPAVVRFTPCNYLLSKTTKVTPPEPGRPLDLALALTLTLRSSVVVSDLA